MILTGKKIYLCNIDGTPITVLNGVDIPSVNYNPHVKDYDTLSFTVDKYIIIDGEQIKSNGYELLGLYMYVMLEDYGVFQMQQPSINNDGNKESKSITAYSREKEFEDKDFENFKVNMGEKDSQEQLIDGNVDELGFAKNFITFYKPKTSDQHFSLLNIILAKMPGWSISDEDIDPILWDKKLSLDEGNVNLYALLTSIIAPKVECLFLFDTINRKVKAISKESLDRETNIFIGFRNLAKSIDITIDEDSVYTRFFCQGDNELRLEDWNYGDNRIFDLSYFMTEPYMSSELIRKVKKWVSWRDDNRNDYADLAKKSADIDDKIIELTNRVPNDGDYYKQWDDMNEESLKQNLKYYNTLLTSLQVSVDDNPTYTPNKDDPNREYIPWKKSDGTIDHDKYLLLLYDLANGYGGYYTYYEVLNYIVPNIEIAIKNLNLPDDNKSDYIKTYETNWELYGLTELQNKQKEYENQLDILKDYAKDWNDLTDEEKAKYLNNEDSYNIKHDEYKKYKDWLGSENTKDTLLYTLKKVKAEIDSLNTELGKVNERRISYVKQASINHESYGFTENDIFVINSLFHDTDYQNTNILSTSVDTTITMIDREKELFDDSVSKLSEVSQPQFKFTVSMDNLLRIPEFKDWVDDFKLLNYVRLGIRDDYSVKLRIVSMSWNPCDITPDITVEFSSMITSRSGRNDLTDILQTENNRGSKNSISIGTGNSKDEEEWRTNLLQLLIKSQIFKQSVGNIASGTTGEVDTAYIQQLVSQYIKTGKIDVSQITGDEAKFKKFFTDYMDADYIVSNTTITKSLTADVATIRNAITGTSSSETNITLNLNANNAKIDSALVKSLISENITVADLKTHIATADVITLISSGTGSPSIAFKDATQQFYDSDGNVRVQIGQDGNGDFNFIVKNGDRTALFDENGITQNGIPNGTIINDMISDKTINKDKLSFNVETDDNGNLVTNINNIYTKDGKWINEYTTYKESTENSLQNLNSKVDKFSPYNILVFDSFGNQNIEDNTVGAIYVRIMKNGEEVDPLKSTYFSSTPPDNPSDGDFYYYLDSDNKKVQLKKYINGLWVNQTDDPEYQYNFYRRDNSGNLIDKDSPYASGKAIYVEGNIITDNKILFEVEVTLPDVDIDPTDKSEIFAYIDKKFENLDMIATEDEAMGYLNIG